MEGEFEFDPAKSAANRDKHGIDFLEARELWSVPAFEQPSPFVEERRWLRIGRIGDRLWTAIYTRRDDRIRMISVRRARKEEVARYGRAIQEKTRDDEDARDDHEP